jgi:hypothetical protein
MMIGAFLALACPTGWAAKVPTVLTFVESWADKVACTGNSSDGFSCNQYTVGKLTIAATITSNDFGAAIDPSQFDQNTTVDITLGDYSFSGTLGGDPNYVAGGKKAKFLVPFQTCDINGNKCRTINETIQLTITKKAVTISISAPTGSDADGNTFENSVDASNFDGNDSGIYSDQIDFEADLDTLSVSCSITPVVAKVTTKDFTDKSGGDDTLSSVKDAGVVPVTDLGQ